MQILTLSSWMLETAFQYEWRLEKYATDMNPQPRRDIEAARSEALTLLESPVSKAASATDAWKIFDQCRQFLMACTRDTPAGQTSQTHPDALMSLDGLPSDSQYGRFTNALEQRIHSSYVLPTKMLKVLDASIDQINRTRSKERQQRADLSRVVALGLASSCGLAVLLVIAYSALLSRRIAMVVDHACKLKDENLDYKRDAGNDELGYLDAVLYGVKQNLIDADKHRHSILEMVAHDVRSPLMAAQVSLGTIEKSLLEAKEKALRNTIAIARSHLRSAVHFVNSLLETEKAATKSQPQPIGEEVDDTSCLRASRRARVASLFKSQMFRKLALLISAPLLLQVGYFLFLHNQMSATESLVKAELLQVDLLTNFECITLRLVRMLSSYLLYDLTGNSKFKDIHDQDRQAVKVALAQAQADTPFDSDKPQLQAIELLLQKINWEDRGGAEHGPDQQNVFGTLGELTTALAILHDKQVAVQPFKSEFLELRAAELQKSMSTVQDCVVVGILLNLALALALAVAFSRSIGNRLRLLMENVQTLGDMDALPRSVGGSDEIQMLDEALQKAKAEISRAAESRKFITTRIVDGMRSPLLVAQAILEDIAAEITPDLPYDATGQLITARNNLIRVTRLIEGLIVFDELERGKLNLDKQHLPLSEIVDESIDGVRSLACEKNIDLIDATQPSYVEADKDRIVQVLTNLLSNAIKFSPENSRVEISSSDSEAAVTLAVKDEGPGMDDAVSDRIFDRYYQQERAHESQGFGLGLAVVKQILEAHGGTVAVVSAPNLGSTFSISLPKPKAMAVAFEQKREADRS
jgi:signal transduction histidine kinase